MEEHESGGTASGHDPSEVIYASSSSDVDIEKQRSSASDDVIHDHVDVVYAEKQFADLKRRYSNLSRVQSNQSHVSRRSRGRKSGLHDAEKGRAAAESVTSDDESDMFDLEDLLRDRRRREEEHDIKPKHLGRYPFFIIILGINLAGVIFEDLTVRGFGGAKYFIRTFPDAVVGFFNLWGTFKSMFGKRKGIEFDILKDFTGCVRPGEVLDLLHHLSLSIRIVADMR